MTACPNCHAEMTPQAEDAFGVVAASLDVYCCASCSLFRFDGPASIRLTPRAVLGLFQYIGQAAAAHNVLVAADELARLRYTVRQISCSQCGAPVDLTAESACPHCGAPITLIDSDGVAKALQDLAAGASTAGPPKPDAGAPRSPTPRSMHSSIWRGFANARADTICCRSARQRSAPCWTGCWCRAEHASQSVFASGRSTAIV